MYKSSIKNSKWDIFLGIIITIISIIGFFIFIGGGLLKLLSIIF